MESNLKKEARRRHEKHEVVSCPYSGASKPATFISAVSKIENQFPESVSAVLKETTLMHMNLVLMKAFFAPLDNFLLRNQEGILKTVLESEELLPAEDRAYHLRTLCSQVMYGFVAIWVNQQISNLPETPEDPRADEFMSVLTSVLSKNEDPDSRFPRTAFFLAMRITLESAPELANDAVYMEQCFQYFMRYLFKKDEGKGVLNGEEFKDLNAVANNLEKALCDKNNKAESTFLYTIDEFFGSYVAVIGAISSLVEILGSSAEFGDLSVADKLSMVKSFKSELLTEAALWSRQFIDHSGRTKIGSAIDIAPDTFCLKPEFLTFDFENLKVLLDGEKMTEDLISPEDFSIQRGCPIAWVKGVDLKGNFLSRQIDFMIEVFAADILKELKTFT